MPFFDFHIHPTLKPLFSPAGKEPSPWQPLAAKLRLLNLSGFEIKLGINALFNNALNSQACLGQLYKGKVNLFGLVLYAPESMLGKGLLEKNVVSDGSIDLVNADKLKIVASGAHYFEWISNELKFLLQNLTPPPELNLPAGVKFKLIKSINEYDPNDLSTLHGFLIVEGMHGFFNSPADANAQQTQLQNFRKFTTDNRVFAVNVTHLQTMPLANHASGMQFLNDSDFYPTGNSISDWGKQMIDEIYSRNILIDIKHLSFAARTALYAYRNEKDYTQPLICTHAGITGIPVQKRLNYLWENPKDMGDVWQVKFYKHKGHLRESAFNASSINLYDEDILQVLNSGGLIGISLDQRITGYPIDHVAYPLDMYPFDQEFISKKEKAAFFGAVADPTSLAGRPTDDDLLSGDEAANQNDLTTPFVHHFYFLNQVIHILFVAKMNHYPVAQAMQQICLGSDFDGLINAIDCCETAEDFSTFKSELKQILDRKDTWKDSGFSFGEIKTNDLLEGLFFQNAFRFLKQHFV